MSRLQCEGRILSASERGNMKKVYLAGPMDGCTEDECHGWRDTFSKAHPDLGCLDPTVRSYTDPFGDKEYITLVEADLDDIRKADALLAYVWKTSGGTSMELVWAHDILHIPTIVVVPNLAIVGPWVRYHAHYVVDNFEEAYELLTK